MNKTFEVNDEELMNAAGGRFVATNLGESGMLTANRYVDEYYKTLFTTRRDLNILQIGAQLNKAEILKKKWANDSEDHTPEDFRTALYNMPITK